MHIIDWNKLISKLQCRGTRVPTEGRGMWGWGGEEEELFRVGLNLTLNVISLFPGCVY